VSSGSRFSTSRRWCSAGIVLALATPFLAFASPPGGPRRSIDAPARVDVGEPAGYTVRDRLDPWRRGRARVALPKAPTERWHVELLAALEHPPLVDATGAVLALLANGDVVRLSSEGKSLWRRRLSCPVSNVPPVLLANASLGVLCSNGALVRLDRDGNGRSPVDFAATAVRVRAAPLPRDDGGIVFALDEELVEISSSGELVARSRLGDNDPLVGGLMPFDGGVLAVTVQGSVWHWRAPLPPRKLGSFAGNTPDGAVLLGSRAVAALTTAEDGVLLLDPVTRRVSSLAPTAGDVRLDELPALAPNGDLLMTTTAGEWLEISSSGEIRRRVELEPAAKPVSPLARSAGLPRRERHRRSPVVVDDAGTGAVFLRDGRFVVVPADGPPVASKAQSCAKPLAVVPAGVGRAIAACASGTLTAWSDP
jgi:hypothetical protein